ncbi:acyltransferase [uncultured Mucilaginibacter sp.]|uniref:acyltransferase family protein n=1 Tax=uncultured Mucilaginibacter sp. TaxID=797541 RepID=UPI0025F97FCE|nr:acyltransferase [uncultured Mucilaginibacter sp.]
MKSIAVNQTQKEKGSRLAELDALRGLAVLTVMLYHYTYAYDFHFNLFSDHKFYLSHGNLAVHLFFIISGFVIFMTLERSKNKFDFIVSRFSRLYPAYWTAIFLTAFIITILPVPTLGHYTPKEILYNITMFQGFTKVRLIDQVYWTLKMELTFYILMYGLYLGRLLRKIEIICIAWLTLSLISSFFSIPLKKYIDVLFILEYAPLFFAGINFYRIKTNGASILNNVIIGISFVVECKWLLTHPDENYGSLVILAGIYALFYLFTYEKLSWLNNKVLLFLGTISYSLYLLHNVIGYTIIYRLRQFSDLQLFYVTVPLIFSILLATFLTYAIEKPALKYIRDAYKKWKARKVVYETKTLVKEPLSNG